MLMAWIRFMRASFDTTEVTVITLLRCLLLVSTLEIALESHIAVY